MPAKYVYWKSSRIACFDNANLAKLCLKIFQAIQKALISLLNALNYFVVHVSSEKKASHNFFYKFRHSGWE